MRLPSPEEIRVLAECEQLLRTPYIHNAQTEQQLRDLWAAVIPEEKGFALRSNLWPCIGFQQASPASDFRGGGLLSLELLAYFATNYAHLCRYLCRSCDSNSSMSRYPWACAGINVCVMMCDVLGIKCAHSSSIMHKVGRESAHFGTL